MSKPIASFEFNKQTISALKKRYDKLGEQLVKELAVEFQAQLKEDVIQMLDKFYMSYHPQYYKRTYTLLDHSWKITRHIKRASGRVTMTWLYDVMQPRYDQALGKSSPEAADVIESFEEGYHGPSWEGISFSYEGATPGEFIDNRVNEIVNDFCNNEKTTQRMVDRALAKIR
jgi:hypothetical protein